MKNLSKREQRLIKRYPNLFNNPLFLNPKTFDYRIINGTPVWNVNLGNTISPDGVTIESNDSIWSVVDYVSKTYVDTAISSIETELSSIETELSSINSRLESVEDDIPTLSQAIQDEATARESADITLGNRITATEQDIENLQDTKLDKTEAQTTYATKTELTQGLSQKQDAETQVLLWSNSNHTQALTETTISVDNIEQYNSFIVLWYGETTGQAIHTTYVKIPTITNDSYWTLPLTQLGGKIAQRWIEFNRDNNTILIENATRVETYGEPGTENNNYVIVSAIIGIK